MSGRAAERPGLPLVTKLPLRWYRVNDSGRALPTMAAVINSSRSVMGVSVCISESSTACCRGHVE